MRRSMIVAGCWGALPIVTWLALNYMRPDLMGAAMAQPIARPVGAIFLLLDGLGTAIMMVGFWLLGLQDPKRTSVRVLKLVVGIVPVLFCFMPAIFIVLVGPLVSASLWGGASP